MSDLEVRGVTTGYGSTEVLSDVDLSVRSGSITAVLGDSGSGKSTLLKVIAGFQRPRTGEVLIDGRLLTGPKTFVAPEQRAIGYVRQDGGLFPHLSVAGNISFGLPFPRRRHRGKVLALLELVGLGEEFADRRPDELSGGQQQRIALARALALDPKIVLLDEPFSALDTALRSATREATAKALREAGATAVLVTHDQAEALSFADEVAVLRGGRFRQVAAPRQVYDNPVDPHVASFMGDAVILPGQADNGQVNCALGQLTVAGFCPSGSCEVLIRPELLEVARAADGAGDALVESCVYYGHDSVVNLRLGATGDRVKARVMGADVVSQGDQVAVTVRGPVRVFPHVVEEQEPDQAEHPER